MYPAGYEINCRCASCIAFINFHSDNQGDCVPWSSEGYKWFRGYVKALVMAEVYDHETGATVMEDIGERLDAMCAAAEKLSRRRA